MIFPSIFSYVYKFDIDIRCELYSKNRKYEQNSISEPNINSNKLQFILFCSTK